MNLFLPRIALSTIESWKYFCDLGVSFQHVCGLALICDVAQRFNSDQVIYGLHAHTHILSAKFLSTSLFIVPFNYRCLLNPYFSQSSWQSIKQHWKRHDIAVCCLTSALTQSLESTLIDTVSLHDLYRLHPAVSGNFFSFTILLIYQIHHEQEKRLGILLWNQSFWR